MRHFLVLLIAVFQITLFSCSPKTVNSNISDAYDFPIKPGTKEWNALDSYIEMVKACEIPEDILEDMSTAGLAETVFNYPFYGNILAFNTPQRGIESIWFNGLRELYKREDAAKELLALYQKKLSEEEINKLKNSSEKGDHVFKVAFLEGIILQDDILSKMSEEELKSLIIDAKEKSSLYQKSGAFSEYSIDFSTWLMGKALKQADFPPFIKAVEENPRFLKYLESGFSLDRDIRNDIKSNVNEFLS